MCDQQFRVSVIYYFFIYILFLRISWGWVRLSPLYTPATIWPIVPAPDDR
jgi:hypothetical protein